MPNYRNRRFTCRPFEAVDVLHARVSSSYSPNEVEMAPRYQNRIELLQGTLDLLILQTLQWGAHHGYGISQAIRSNSGEVFQVDTGSLYPALHRLEQKRWIASQWAVSENKQRIKLYRLTTAGKKQ